MCVLQGLGCPVSKTADYTTEFKRVVDGAPIEWQEVYFRQKPVEALAAATGKKKKYKKEDQEHEFPTGGGILAYLNMLASNRQRATEEYYKLCMQVGVKYEAGELSTCRAKGLDLIGKQLTAVKRKAGRPPKQTFVMRALYDMIGGIQVADQLEMMDDMIANIRTWEGAKKVCLCACLKTLFSLFSQPIPSVQKCFHVQFVRVACVFAGVWVS